MCLIKQPTTNKRYTKCSENHSVLHTWWILLLKGRLYEVQRSQGRLSEIKRVHIWQFGQMHFLIWTITFSNLEKYIFQFRRAHFPIWTNIFPIWTNTIKPYNVDPSKRGDYKRPREVLEGCVRSEDHIFGYLDKFALLIWTNKISNLDIYISNLNKYN